MMSKIKITTIGSVAIALVACQTPPPEPIQLPRPVYVISEASAIGVAPSPTPRPRRITATPNEPQQARPRPSLESVSPAEQELRGRLPEAKPVEGKPGFVESPYGARGIIDVRGMPPKTLAKDPYVDKPFIVP